MNIPAVYARRVRLALLLCAGWLIAPATQAAQAGFYVGGFYGEATKDTKDTPFDADATSIFDQLGFIAAERSVRTDDKDKSYGFQGGYRLNEYVAFEGGYIDLGGLEYREVSSGEWIAGPSTFTLNFDTKTSGFALSALGILPLSYRLEVYARAGLLLATNKYKVYLATDLGPLQDEIAESSTELLAGAGASFSFLEIYGLRLEFLRVFDAGKPGIGGEGDIDMLSLGVTVTF